MKRLTPLLVALPAFAIAIGGLFHPEVLTPDTAGRWWTAHLVLLPLFPLVGVSVWWLLRGETGPVAQGARLLAYAYAVLYTALDSMSGIGLGYSVDKAAERGNPLPDLGPIFSIGDDVGRPGALALAIAGVLVGLLLAHRDHWVAGVGGALVFAGALLVWKYHVFPYKGVLGMALVGVGLAAMAAARLAVPQTAKAGHPGG